jgi:hypothetical protein
LKELFYLKRFAASPEPTGMALLKKYAAKPLIHVTTTFAQK